MSNVVGVAPGFILLPAREYEWELQRKIEITIPLKGSIKELLDPKSLAEGVKITGDDSFSVFEDNVLLLWEAIRVLFASAQYPSLRDDESLNVVAIGFEDNQATLYGEIIRSVG